MLKRLCIEALARGEDVPVRGPRVRGAARDDVVAEVTGRNAAVLRRKVELRGCLVVQARGGLAGVDFLAQFHTLTSR